MQQPAISVLTPHAQVPAPDPLPVAPEPPVESPPPNDPPQQDPPGEAPPERDPPPAAPPLEAPVPERERIQTRYVFAEGVWKHCDRSQLPRPRHARPVLAFAPA